MNRLKPFNLLTVSFFIFLGIPIYSEWSGVTHVRFSTFTNQGDSRDRAGDRIHGDFSHEVSWAHSKDRRGLSGINSLKSYSAEDFKKDFVECGYTESEILNQRCLYMLDEFVKYAQTYSGYEDTIRSLYVELKNLSLVQKVCHMATGKYCRKLQKRIGDLYKSLDAIKKEPLINGYYNPADIVEKTFKSTFSENFAEYGTLESVYKSHMPNLAKAISARSVIYRNSADSSFDFQLKDKSYNLNSNIKQLLSRSGHDFNTFARCYGNQLQQVIHQESLDILNHVYNLTPSSILYDHQEALIDLTVSIVEYNHANMPDKSMCIADFCWTLLDYGQAVMEGVALGLYSAVQDILTNPIEATVSIVAGKQILAFQLCKVLYNVADIGATAIHDFKGAQEKWDKYTEPLNHIIDAINKKEITVRDAIKGGTAFVVVYKAQGKLLGGLGKLCNTIKRKSINFVKNNPLFSPQEYLTTPEGLLFKVTGQSNKAPVNSVGNLKNTVEKLAGTVWKNIKATDKMYPGTKIPKSFELAIGKQKFWVAPNATKHMLEYLQDTNGTHKKIITHNMPINCQALLSSMQVAVERAISSGVKYDTMIKIGCWEFRFGMPRDEGLLPSIYHANFKPKNW